MLRAYIDDSGKPDQSPVMVLAGYLSSAERWACFTNEWTSILDAHSLDALHMTDLWRKSYPEHAHLSPLARDQLLSKLVQCIRSNVMRGFVNVMPFSGFERYLKVRESGPLSRPYFWMFFSMLSRVYELSYRYNADEKTEMLFDVQGGESEARIMEALGELRNIAAPRYGEHFILSPSFRDDKDLPPLQAADMLAWTVRRVCQNGVSANITEKGAESFLLDQLMTVPTDQVLWSEEKLIATSMDLLRRLGVTDASPS